MADSEQDQPQSKAASSGEVLLRGDVRIFPDKPLPHLNRGTAKAFVAESKKGNRAFAMICPDNLVPRTSIVHKYMNVSSGSLPRISASGVVDWTPENREKYVFVYENDMGKPLSALRTDQQNLGLKLDMVLNTVFYNLVEAISALHDRGVAHGNICLPNIYDGNSTSFENVILGECLSVPSGFAQPALYETIERSLASPLAKGEATYADDIYALGMSLAMMIAPHDFAANMSAEEIMLHKLEHGTFNLVTSRDRFPGAIIEVLRGLLNDDISSRWTIWDVKEWMEGHRVAAKQGARAVPKSTRPIEFRKKKYFRPDVLATQLYKDPAAALALVESGDLFMWLNRALQSKEYEERYEAAVEQAKKNSTGANFSERIVSYLTMALAPNFPIFYRGMIFFPEYFGNLLADAVIQGKDVNIFAEVLQGEIIPFWASCRYKVGLAVGEEAGKFESGRMYLAQKSPGFGIERCVYVMTPSAKCLSGMLTMFCARSSKDIVLALDKIGTQKDKPAWFFDRHIIAYLFTHDRHAIESFSADLMADDSHRQVSAVLKVLARVQDREKIPTLQGLSLWIGEHIPVLVNRYHDRERRKQITLDVEKIKAKGNLVMMAELFSNYQEIQNDMKMFTQAMMQFQNLKQEYMKLELDLQTNKSFGKGTGHQIATMVSGAIAALVVLIYMFMSFSFS